jgi:hypothetical protein
MAYLVDCLLDFQVPIDQPEFFLIRKAQALTSWENPGIHGLGGIIDVPDLGRKDTLTGWGQSTTKRE